MNNVKMKWMLVFSLILTLLIMSQVSAYGIAPAKKAINFEPGMEKEITFLALSTGDFPSYFTVELSGTLAQYAEINKNNLFLDIGETKEEFVVKLKLPEELPAGPNTLYVTLIEQDVNSQATATAKNALIGQVIVHVPYTGIYVDSKLDIEHAEISKPMTFTVSLLGRGDVSASCYAEINIKDAAGNKLDTIVTNRQMVAQGEATKIEAVWSENHEKGLFDAEATIHCGDKTNTLVEQFYVGNPSVKVLNIEAEKFFLGDINPISITLQNNWNREFKNAYVEILVMDKLGKLIHQFKSATQAIGAEEIKEYTAYWETKDLNVGLYNLSVITYFDTKGTLQESFMANVGINELDVYRATGRVTGVDGKDSSMMSVIVLLLVILVIMNGGLIFYFKSKKRKS